MNMHGLIWCKKCLAIVGCCHRSDGKPAVYVVGPNGTGERVCNHDRNKDWEMRVQESTVPTPEQLS